MGDVRNGELREHDLFVVWPLLVEPGVDASSGAERLAHDAGPRAALECSGPWMPDLEEAVGLLVDAWWSRGLALKLLNEVGGGSRPMGSIGAAIHARSPVEDAGVQGVRLHELGQGGIQEHVAGGEDDPVGILNGIPRILKGEIYLSDELRSLGSTDLLTDFT